MPVGSAAIAAAIRTLPAQQAYLDGELCGVRPDGVASFALIQNAAERQGGADLLYFVFDLLHPDGRNLMPLPLADRKAGLAALLERSEVPIRYSEHKIGQGPAFHRYACALGLEGIVSKRLDAGYSPGQRGLWLKTKCLNREEFVIVGWTDPEGSRPFIGALLLGYYDPGGRLVDAGRVGPGCGPISSKISYGGYSRCRPTECRSMRRRAQPGSARRWCRRGSIGSGPSSSSRSSI